jgi:hypothetical protein
MSVPPELMKALGGAGPAGVGPAGAPPGRPMPPPPQAMPGGAPPVAGPAGGPMMAPSRKEGSIAGGKADIQVVVKKLTQSLQIFPPTTDEGKAIMKAITALTKGFGETRGKDQELMPAEIMQALSGLAGPGKPPPGLPMPAGPAPLPTPM